MKQPVFLCSSLSCLTIEDDLFLLAFLLPHPTVIYTELWCLSATLK